MFRGLFESDFWWLQHRPVAGMPRPRVAPPRRHNPTPTVEEWDDDLLFLWESGFRSVICLTDSRDKNAFKTTGFQFTHFDIEDGHPPTDEQVHHFLHIYRSAKRDTAVHCEGGVGRTGTMLATVLISEGQSAHDAIKTVRYCNRSAIETKHQEEFLLNLRLN
ncbi:MAG: protein-tyrosine phosphatase family protein [Verrucomicrobiota bacterium]